MTWDKEKVYLFTGGVDMKVRSWMAEIGSEAKVFEGATRSVSVLLVRGNIRKCSWCMEKMKLVNSKICNATFSFCNAHKSMLF